MASRLITGHCPILAASDPDELVARVEALIDKHITAKSAPDEGFVSRGSQSRRVVHGR